MLYSLTLDQGKLAAPGRKGNLIEFGLRPKADMPTFNMLIRQRESFEKF